MRDLPPNLTPRSRPAQTGRSTVWSLAEPPPLNAKRPPPGRDGRQCSGRGRSRIGPENPILLRHFESVKRTLLASCVQAAGSLGELECPGTPKAYSPPAPAGRLPVTNAGSGLPRLSCTAGLVPSRPCTPSLLPSSSSALGPMAGATRARTPLPPMPVAAPGPSGRHCGVSAGSGCCPGCGAWCGSVEPFGRPRTPISYLLRVPRHALPPQRSVAAESPRRPIPSPSRSRRPWLGRGRKAYP